jgi:PAS domain S-box-containing protein
VLLAAAAFPLTAAATCQAPLPVPALQRLDDQVDTDPRAVNAEVARRLKALGGTDALQAAVLYTIQADAYDSLDDNEQARAAVAAGRSQLRRLPAGEARQTLELRLALTDADAPRSRSEMLASVDSLTRLEGTLPPQSLDRSCLLVVRSRLNAQLMRHEEATRDGIASYRIASLLHAPGAAAEAAYQLSMTYLRAGLLQAALGMADEAAAYYRSSGQLTGLSNALYMKGHVLDEMHDYPAALDAISESRDINVRLHETIEVAFADGERCNVLFELAQLDPAERACQDALEVWTAGRRAEMAVATEATLARIELARDSPRAALARLDRVLRTDRDQIRPIDLPRLHRYRSEALTRLGRYADALKDLRESLQLTESEDAQRSSLAAATIKEQLDAERDQKEKAMLATQMLLARQKAAGQERQLRLSIALGLSAAMLFVLTAYLLLIRTRHERAQRRASEKLDAHGRVITTVREGVLLVDDRGLIEYANPALLRLFGVSFEELKGTPVERLGISADSLEDQVGDAAGGLPEGARELHLHGGNGMPIVLLLTSSKLRLRDRMLLVCVLQDVTELRRLEREVLTNACSERLQLSSDVHEGIAQDLAGIALLLKGVTGRGESDEATLEFLVGHVNHVLQLARALARGLSPVQVAGGSLTLALKQFAADIAKARAIEVDCHSELGDLELTAAQSDHLYRIALECLRFAARRPDTRRILVELRVTGDALLLSTTGDGSALAERRADDERSWGTIAYLARLIGGSGRIESLPDARTRTTALVPLEKLGAGDGSPDTAVDTAVDIARERWSGTSLRATAGRG